MNRKNWLYAINAIVFLVLIIYLGVLSLLLPAPTESEVERRDLATRPEFSLQSYYAQQFTRDFDTYYADAFPGRESFIKLSYALDSIKGLEGEVKLYQSNVREEQKPTESSSVPPESNASAPSESDPLSAVSEPQSEPEPEPESASSEVLDAVDENAYLNNNIFIYKNAAYQLFFGDDESAERYAQIVSSYAAELPGVNVYAQVIPQPFNFYLPNKYRKMGRNEKEYAAFLHSKLTDGAKGVRVYEELEKNKSDYLYFRTDTHWTARGAYCAYLAFCDAAGFTPVPLESMEKRQVPGDFLGYLYTLTMDKNLAATPDYVEYFIVPGIVTTEAIFDRAGASKLSSLPSMWAEDRRGGNAYSTFIYGDLPYMKVTTSAGTGRSALLIKDSYGNAFAPYLVSHYDELHILDERYFPYSVYELIKREGIDDVIISQSSYSANALSHQKNLISLKKGHSGKPLPDFDATAASSQSPAVPKDAPTDSPEPLTESESSSNLAE